MKVPEDLQKVLDTAVRLWSEQSPAGVVGKVITDYFAAHDLIDLTLCGPQCPSLQTQDCDAGLDDGGPWCAALWAKGEGEYYVTPGQPCPALAARKEWT